MAEQALAVTYETEAGARMALDAATVRGYLVKGNGKVTDGEVMMFLHRCRDMRLDPFSSDVSLVKYGDSAPASIIVGKDAFVKRADANPQFDGMEFGIVVSRDGEVARREGAMLVPGEKLLGGWARVWRKDRSRPSTAEVSFCEYSSGKSSWAKMPATMIAKVAKSQALREAFPNSLSGLYESEEMDAASQAPSSGERPSEGLKEAREGVAAAMRRAAGAGVAVSDVKRRAVEAYGRPMEEMNAADLARLERDVEEMEKAAREAAAAEGPQAEEVEF